MAGMCAETSLGFATKSNAPSASAFSVAEAPAAPSAERGAADSADSYSSLASTNSVKTQPAIDAQQIERAVIRKGNVELRADDVGKAQFDVQKVVNRYAGEVTEEKTTTDDDGKPAYTNMVLRIPTDRFNDAMEELKGVEDAELVSANSSENDVTTKLIDTQTRLAAQKRSIARITVLFDRAESIRDIMAIEAELSRRQADLDSLERQAAFLRGQTAMSTITVSIDKIPAKKAAAKPKDDDTGFVAGFKAGWDALTAFAVALATALGAFLPWLVVILIVAPLAWLVARPIRRRISKPGRTPSAA